MRTPSKNPEEHDQFGKKDNGLVQGVPATRRQFLRTFGSSMAGGAAGVVVGYGASQQQKGHEHNEAVIETLDAAREGQMDFIENLILTGYERSVADPAMSEQEVEVIFAVAHAWLFVLNQRLREQANLNSQELARLCAPERFASLDMTMQFAQNSAFSSIMILGGEPPLNQRQQGGFRAMRDRFARLEEQARQRLGNRRRPAAGEVA